MASTIALALSKAINAETVELAGIKILKMLVMANTNTDPWSLVEQIRLC